MRTEVISIQDPRAIARAVTALQAHQVIAVPTDTVYGLICRYDSLAAVETLYTIKGRPAQKALPLLLAGPEQLSLVVADEVPAAAARLMARFWPGPLTLVLAARPELSPRLTAGGATVGVRVPAHEPVRQIARQVGPLASSSANRSSKPACRTVAQLLAQLEGLLPLVLDGGTTGAGAASTVVRTLPAESGAAGPIILREGAIGAQVRAFWAAAAGADVDPKPG